MIYRHLKDYFDRAAKNYAYYLEPVFGIMAQGLVELASIRPGEWVLDLGTGTGAVARCAAQISGSVVALDFSRDMLLSAQQRASASRYVQSDLHQVGLRAAAFDVALASFAFNSTDPRRSFREAARILVPGGRLALQEWGQTDTLSSLVFDTIAEYSADDVSPTLAAMRELMSLSVPWDRLETLADIRQSIRDAGFSVTHNFVRSPDIPFADVTEFLRYKLAWPNRRAELAAMSDETRNLCLTDLRENISPYCEPGGKLIWRPEIIRIVAVRPYN